jgi:carbon starvation protein
MRVIGILGHIFAAAGHDRQARAIRRWNENLSGDSPFHPRAGFIAGFAILFIVLIAIAEMAKVVVNALAESAWGTFIIGVTIPIALFMVL